MKIEGEMATGTLDTGMAQHLHPRKGGVAQRGESLGEIAGAQPRSIFYLA
ncbi:MAG: hypothetical protein Kow00106_17090 [Anaerolineae bacterium]